MTYSIIFWKYKPNKQLQRTELTSTWFGSFFPIYWFGNIFAKYTFGSV